MHFPDSALEDTFREKHPEDKQILQGCIHEHGKMEYFY